MFQSGKNKINEELAGQERTEESYRVGSKNGIIGLYRIINEVVNNVKLLSVILTTGQVI